MKLTGAEKMAARIRAFAKAYPDRVGAAVYQEAQVEMTEAKQRTPVSPTPAPAGVVPGSLRASGRVSPPEREGNSVKVTLSFGGPGIDYAVAQHERLDYLHTTGQAKYLESVLDESAPHMAARLAARLKLDGEGEAGE
jgi:hypothetical protein